MAVIKHFHQSNDPIAGEGGLPPPNNNHWDLILVACCVYAWLWFITHS